MPLNSWEEKKEKKLIFLTIFIKKTRAEYRVMYPKNYKNLYEYCTFAVVGQIRLSGQYWKFLLFCYYICNFFEAGFIINKNINLYCLDFVMLQQKNQHFWL